MHTYLRHLLSRDQQPASDAIERVGTVPLFVFAYFPHFSVDQGLSTRYLDKWSRPKCVDRVLVDGHLQLVQPLVCLSLLFVPPDPYSIDYPTISLYRVRSPNPTKTDSSLGLNLTTHIRLDVLFFGLCRTRRQSTFD